MDNIFDFDLVPEGFVLKEKYWLTVLDLLPLVFYTIVLKLPYKASIFLFKLTGYITASAIQCAFGKKIH